MTELITAVQEILDAETLEGKLLEGWQVLDDSKTNQASQLIELERGEQRVLGSSGPHEYVDAVLLVNVYVQVPKLQGASWREQEAIAETGVRLIRKIIGGNRDLASTSYPSGLVEDGDDVTKFGLIRPISAAMKNRGGFYTGLEMELKTEYILRSGALSLT